MYIILRFSFAAHLICHWICVDLAHVLSAIVLLNLVDMQVEVGLKVPGDGDARVVRDHGVVKCLDRLRVSLDPTHLK